ncbi:MAG TPA: Calx-beta domain-containing protein [Caldilineaceae bacterium]|nr:Calx-beta domain-containing protein [Caldilineaceae bacterium]
MLTGLGPLLWRLLAPVRRGEIRGLTGAVAGAGAMLCWTCLLAAILLALMAKDSPTAPAYAQTSLAQTRSTQLAPAQVTPTVGFGVARQTVSEAASSLLVSITLDITSTAPVTLTITSESITAQARNDHDPGDYDPIKRRVMIPAGQRRIDVPVTLNPDDMVEPDEELALHLSIPQGAALGPISVTTALILNDDSANLEAGEASAGEGEGGLAFPIYLSALSALTTEVSYMTQDDTAGAPGDYVPQSGRLLLPPGVTVMTVTIPVVDDDLIEPDERLWLAFTDPVNAALLAERVSGVIVDNDQDPFLSVADSTAVEREALIFTVALDRVGEQSVRARFATADGTATAPDDYQAMRGVLSIPAGSLAISLTVPLVDDPLVEAAETFTLTLSAPEGARLSQAQAIGRIQDNDGSTIGPAGPLRLYLPGLQH